VQPAVSIAGGRLDVGCPEKARRLLDVAGINQHPNARRRDGLARVDQKRHDAGTEPPVGRQRLRRPRALRTEAEVRPDADVLGAQPVHEHPINELGGRNAGPGRVEGHHDDFADTE